MKNIYVVEGMHCASCSQIIDSKLSKMSGIQKVEVNFATKKANIEFDENIVGENDIFKEMKKFGYTFIGEEKKEEHIHNHTEHKYMDDGMEKAKQKVIISIPMVIISFGAMIYSVGIEYGFWEKKLLFFHSFMGVLPIFATVMLTVVGWKYVVAVGRYMRYGVANMDTLVGIGTLTAFIYTFISKTFKEIIPFPLPEQGFYEAVIIVIGFIELGKYMEVKIMSKTGKAIQALVGLQSKNALILRDEKEILLPLEEVKPGDIMIVKPGEKIPLDGVIVDGKGDIDESMITGESLPVQKNIGDTVIGSTIVSNSIIYVRATHVGADTYLSKIITIVEQAQNSKPEIQKLVDQIMKYFIPTALIIACISFIFWMFFGNRFFPDINNIQFALFTFVGVLIIACPCGLGLATPMAIITGVGLGAKNGILAKNAGGLLKLRKTNIVVFDKTGTITEGKPKLVEIQGGGEKGENISILASLEALSSHPIASAIVEYAIQKNISLKQVKNFKNLEGVGVEGEIHGKIYTVSKPTHLDNYDSKIIESWTKEGKTPLVLSLDKKILGYYAIADEVKPNSEEVIKELKKIGITPIMLTGDHKNTAEYIAKKVGIERVYAQVKPDGKALIIEKLKKEGIVTMVGDGINDAPALATADNGIAMSTGTDIAIESSDLTLLAGDLSKLFKAIKISKITQIAIIQNLSWAFGFNLIGIPLAAGLFFPIIGILLNPAFEGVAMALSSLTVMGNSLRLQKKKI